MDKKIIMNEADIRRTLARIAHEIIERNKYTERLVLVGMRTRGVPLANRLAANIESFEKEKVAVGALDFSLYRDDLSSLDLQPIVKSTDLPVTVLMTRLSFWLTMFSTPGEAPVPPWMPSLTWGVPTQSS